MRRLLVGTLAVLLLPAPFAHAQEFVGWGRRLTLAAGPVLISQRDENASPLQYGGAAPSVELGYVTQTDRGRLELRLGGAIGTLGSALTQDNDLPRQKTWRGEIEVEYAHALGATDSRTRWFLGARVAAHGTAIHHLYAHPGGGGYAFVSVALGPVVAVQRATSAHSMLDAQVGTAVLALIERPYGVLFADFSLIPGGLRPRIATLDAFQAADFTAAYTAGLGGTEIVVYRLVVERYRDLNSFRYASQGLSVALRLRLGAEQ